MPWWRGVAARGGYVLVGAVAGGSIAWSSRYRGTDEWVVWAACAVAFATGSGAVFGYGLARWPDIVAFGLPQHAAGRLRSPLDAAAYTSGRPEKRPGVSPGPVGHAAPG